MTSESRPVEIEYIDVVNDDTGESEDYPGNDCHDDEKDGWLAGFRQLIKGYVLNEPDVARVSNESEAFVLIDDDSLEEIGDQDMEPSTPIDEEVFSTKVTSEESCVSPAAETEPEVNGVSQERKIERKRSTTNINLTQGEMDNNKAKRAISSRLAQFQKACEKENEPSQVLTRSGSKKLDLSKYQSGGGDGENKRASMTKRLDTSRFSKFQGDSTDGAVPSRVTRNFTISPSNRKSGFQKPAVVTSTTNSKCTICTKTVYPMEKITADSQSYHKTCFRCTECNRCLTLGSFAQLNQLLYCKPHFKQLFKLKGNYDEGFQRASHSLRFKTSADAENGFDTEDGIEPSEGEEAQFEGAKNIKDQFEKGPVSNVEIKKTFDREEMTRSSPEERLIPENEPVVRPDVVRSCDMVEDQAAAAPMRSLRDQFEKGETPPASTAKSVDVLEEMRVAKEMEIQASEGQVSESTPVRNEDVVRSDEKSDDVMAFTGGIRSLKDRFEKGAVSNLDSTPSRPVMEVRSLADYNPESAEKGVSENTPVVRDDVVKSSEKMDDPFFKTGGARSLRARFEQGNVSNIEEKPREKIDISSRPLEERALDEDEADQGGISENTPVQRDDVVKGGPSEEDPGIKRGAARNLRNLFEKGEVHNVEEKPRAPLERSPKSLDQLAPSTEGVIENDPEVRTDLVRETSARDEPMNIKRGGSRSLKDRWEKGDVETAPAKEAVDIQAELRGQGQVSESNPEVREDLVRESSDLSEEKSGGASSLRAQWEAGDVVHAENRVEKPELSPKRLSAYYEDDDQAEEPAKDEVLQVEEPEAEVKPEAEFEPEPEAEAEFEPEPEAEAEFEPEPEAEAEVEPEPEAEAEFEPEPEAEAEPEPEPELELQEEAEPELEAEPEVLLEVEEDVELEVESEKEPEAEQEEEEGEQIANGHSSQNGFEIEVVTSPENEEAQTFDEPAEEIESPSGQDIASWEIKAARASGLQSQDVDEDAHEYANEGNMAECDDSGLMIDIGDGDLSLGVTVGNDDTPQE